MEAKLGVQRTIDRIMRAIEDGLYQPSMKAHLTELEAEKASLAAQQTSGSIAPKISVHPNLAAVYRRKVEELETLLEEIEHRDEAMEFIRTLIEKIELTPKDEGGLDAVLHGDLAGILALCSAGAGELKPLRAVAVSGTRTPKALRGFHRRRAFVFCVGCGDRI
ncbi:hypothetical protein [Microvirga zambiensis]|uniref:hypothetical protein n=1 Tax=Microvirga zambiensis TaxID=1402137 RepID=UPI00192001EB|nr:hypothetical protein [Microvirga zambiensis]